MQRSLMVAMLISGLLPTYAVCQTASLPSSVLPAVTQAIQQDFTVIEKVETYSMSDDIAGQFDIVVVGTGRARHEGWRVEVFSVHKHRLTKRWDSAVAARGAEFDVIGLGNIDMREKESDYDLLVDGCVPHMCHDGISGFLVFSGKTGRAYKAKLVTQGLDKDFTESPKYDVTFSEGISDDAKKVLQEAICNSYMIGNKQGLPFTCKNP
jgi:hypothetical protein